MLNLRKGDRRVGPSGTPLGRRAGVSRQEENERAPTSIGIAHVVFGAVGLTSAGVGLLFNANSPLLVAVLVGRIGFELLTCYAGLLISDGRRRGALIAIATGMVRTMLLALSGARGLTLVVSVVLIGAVVWLMPTLRRDKPGHSSA